jgi:hypothetical protein
MSTNAALVGRDYFFGVNLAALVPKSLFSPFFPVRLKQNAKSIPYIHIYEIEKNSGTRCVVPGANGAQ